MLCQRCEQNQATTHYQETINEQTRVLHLCTACANELTNAASNFGWAFGQLPAFFTQSTDAVRRPAKDEPHCPTCGMSETQLRRSGRVGCADCYQTFHEMLLPYIKKLHGAAAHVGPTPTGASEGAQPSPLQALKAKLADAVREENYEEAARLRDEVRRLEGEDK